MAGLPPIPGLASITGALGAAAPAPAPKIDPSQTKEICDQFKSLFRDNEKLYADTMKDAIKKGVEEYFGNEEMMKELNVAFSKAILQYMNNQNFKAVAQAEVSKVLGEILRVPIERALKNREQYTNVCKAILATKRPSTGGRRTKSNRKAHKITIKRRR